jgi:hypothetical protein
MTLFTGLFPVIFLWFGGFPALAADYIPLDPRKRHLDFNLEKGPFDLSFLKLKGQKKAEIEVDDQGLWVGGNRVCV